MPKFICTIDVCGPSSFVIEAATEEKAREELYRLWLEECENQCDRQLRPYSQELAEQLDVEEET